MGEQLRTIEGFQGAAFGLADGVICILGMIVGVAVATQDVNFILIAGITGGLADALGNSFGFYLSELTERGTQIYQKSQGKDVSAHSMREVLASGVLSFAATVFALVILLIPFLLTNIWGALAWCCVEGAVVLFLLGLYVGRLSGENPAGMGVRYVILGAIGAVLSFAVGDILKVLILSL
ncbi:MAG TPA: VIT1/CCC1 transporter family protein [Thermoproteota archaeon]|nr:VIT1/CCC1 transporter family protein [Thermoproteota archaeon]